MLHNTEKRNNLKHIVFMKKELFELFSFVKLL